MEAKSGVTRRIIHELLSWEIQGDQTEVKVVLLEVSLMKLVFWISKEVK